VRDVVLLVARLLLCLIYIVFGFGKIFTISGFAAGMAAKGMPFPEVFPYLAILIELGGGIVLGFGIETGVMAVLFAIYTLATGLIGHPFWTMDDPGARTANAINFYKNLAMIGGFLLLAVSGGGRFSLDALRHRRSNYR